MVFKPIVVGTNVQLNGRTIRSLPASHTVPALGYQLSSSAGSLVFSGDTGPNDEFWHQVNAIQNLRYLIIENAFSNREQDLAMTAKHLFPIQLAQELSKLQREAKILITHLKPSDRDLIAREVAAWAGRFAPRMLEGGDVIEF